MGIREFDYVSSIWSIVRSITVIIKYIVYILNLSLLYCVHMFSILLIGPLQIGLFIVVYLNFVRHNSLIRWNEIDSFKCNSISICFSHAYNKLLISFYLQNNQSKDKWRNLVHILLSQCEAVYAVISTNKVLKHTKYRTGCETEIL